ncbi:hypothetical protein OG205_09335 [Lentzea sp. NBC_00516]|uniref:DUF6884 domain-containing protein n=1 Tax=Lentzea sp. NBC_00516 TaxID=2903582 RepID=UPI002E8156A5|nr:DUF6884 domain-containing protein [Lentzea sp. NBC_00516]WUD27177.1 hypothetical protein OG205_09335 [Lentzea sp. NBC_00516]
MEEGFTIGRVSVMTAVATGEAGTDGLCVVSARPWPYPPNPTRRGLEIGGFVARIVFVIPCGGAKLFHQAPARELYTGSMFRFCLAVAVEEADLAAAAGHDAAVRILSAKHGLLELDTLVAPYDVVISSHYAVAATVVAEQLMDVTQTGRAEIYTFLPQAYLARLCQASELAGQRGGRISVNDLYWGSRGIGDQRRVLSELRRSRSSSVPQPLWRRRSTRDRPGNGAG